MRIFSIHKSKSKKQVSEKNPKLAAQKFLEKKKVGTVIYLHEHSSGKIHGPYRKDYDKKIMKGGAWSFGSLSKSEFKVRIPLEILYGTDQLLIKQTRRDIYEPHIFFGPKNFKFGRDNYYKFAVFNKYGHMRSQNNKNSFFRGLIECQEITAIGTVGKTMSDIEPEILLGLYYQYILRCKEDYDSLEYLENYDGLYMKRLFLYLLLYVLPILIKYIEKIINKYDNKSMKEQSYFELIFNYVDSINLDLFIDMFARCYHMPESIKKQIKSGYIKKEKEIVKINNGSVQNLENLAEEVIRSSVSIHSVLESPQSSFGSGAITTNMPHPLAIIPFIPFIVIGGVLYGSFFLGKAIIQQIKQRRNR